MPLFRKKPVTVEAIKYIGSNLREVIDFTNGTAMTNTCYSHLSISTKEGTMSCELGDYMIKEPFPTGDRDFYPCKPDIFEKTYDLAQD